MKNKLLIIFAAALIAMCLTACKGSEENRPDMNGATANELPNAESSYYMSNEPVNNGIVTDRNGIIGDEDDRHEQPSNPIGNAVENIGDTIDNAGDKVGDTVSNITSNAGNMVSNAASNVGNTVSNITDNAGDVVENAADKASDTTDNR